MAHEGHEHRGVDTAMRAIDLGIAGTTLIVLSPVIATIAVSIKLTSGGPVLYHGRRVGRAGRIFTMLKFRTLTPDAEARLGPYLGEELTQRTRTEVTRLGRVLRFAHLDELPQLWNVIRGDMSIVGPRPIRPAFFEELCEEIPQYWQRLVVEPGLTGLRPAANDPRDVLGREARARPRVRRGPLRAAVPARCLATAWRIISSPGARGLQPLAMCGICGLAVPRRRPVDPGVVHAMNETLVHRGPDSAGCSPRRRSALAARRLSIIDLDGADQPIGNEDGRIQVVQNGEIYNYRELRERLERARPPFRTQRRHRGARPPLRGARARHSWSDLRGMFAIALWDRLEQRLVLARDRFGIKPLYYRLETRMLSFASELKALLRQPEMSRDSTSMRSRRILAFNSIPAPLTIFREARKLPPGPSADRRAGRGAAAPLRAPATGRRPATSAPRARRSSRWSCASGCATPCAPISWRMFRSA